MPSSTLPRSTLVTSLDIHHRHIRHSHMALLEYILLALRIAQLKPGALSSLARRRSCGCRSDMQLIDLVAAAAEGQGARQRLSASGPSAVARAGATLAAEERHVFEQWAQRGE